MLRAYNAQRRMGGYNPLGVGTIPLGAMFYVQDRSYWGARYGRTATCRNPWQVIGFVPGDFSAARRNPATGFWESIRVANRFDTAVLKSLRDGRVQTIAIHFLQVHEEHGFRSDGCTYPTRPRLDLHPRASSLVEVKAEAPLRRTRRPAPTPMRMAA